jgi:electron transport complex protein RnfG
MADHATDPTPRAGTPWRSALLLVVVAVLAFGLVAVVHEATRDTIAAKAHERQMARFAEVLHGQTFDNDLIADSLEVRDPELLGTSDPVRAYRARLHGEPVAVVLTPVAPDGYAGSIGLLVAITPAGKVLGVRVTQHKETPGIGDRIETRKSNWILGFAGRSLGDPPRERWGVRRDGGDFDQFTGATVTPRAVVHAVANALEYFERHRDELLAPPATPTRMRRP